MNIAEILKKYAKQDDTFYTLSHGRAQLCEVKDDVILLNIANGGLGVFNMDGGLSNYGECLLFPSKECRDWNEYVKQKEAEVWDLKVGEYVAYEGRQYIIDDIEEDWLALISVVGYVGHNVTRKEVTPCKKFDPTLLHSFDKVIVRTDPDFPWVIAEFSHIERNLYVSANYNFWQYCIPYNSETEHLVGKIDEAPEFYREE